MSTIPASRDVNINPGVLNAGGSALDLISVWLTTTARVPMGVVQSFPTALSVAQYFGYASPEYLASLVYFGGFRGETKQPAALKFATYNQSACAAFLRGGNVASALTLAQLQALSGSLSVAIDGQTHTGSSINLSSASSWSAAAAIIQTALDATEPTEASVTGSISGTTMTVSAVSSGTVSVGATVTGTGIAAGTIITGLLTGTGLTGTYQVNNSQTVSSETLTIVATALTVTFDSVSGAFVVTSGITGAPSTAAFATGTLAASLMLTQATGAVVSQGAAAAVPGTFMTALTQVDQNWATFKTMFDPDNGSGNAQKLLFSAWTSAQDSQYAYICVDTDASPSASSSATGSLSYLIGPNGANYSGTCLVWEPSTGGPYYHGAFVTGFTAAIDFEALNGRATLKFKGQDGLQAAVTNSLVGSNLDANGYNHMDAVATANETWIYMAQGVISGKFQWFDSYINQIWLNNALQLALIDLLNNVKSIPYNAQGYALIEAACLDPIQQAINFGAIRVGVSLSNAQKAEIANAAGKDVSQQLSAQGFYLQVVDPTPQVRQARGTPVCNLWYTDGESVHQITLNSIDVQ